MQIHLVLTRQCCLTVTIEGDFLVTPILLAQLTTATWKYDLHVSTQNTLTQTYEGKKVGAVIDPGLFRELKAGNKHVTSEFTH